MFAMNENELNIFIDKIKNAKSIAIMGHKNPDGDSLCSVLALARLIEINFGCRPVCVYDGNISDTLENIPRRGYVKYYGRVDMTEPFDLAIVVDYGTVNHIGGPMPILEKANFIVEIDHHKNDSKIGQLCLDDENASAAGEIIYNIMRSAGWEYDTDVASLLTVAIITDTGHFKFARNGTPMRIVGDLVDAGVRIRALLDSMNNRPRKSVLTDADVISKTQFYYHGRLAVANVTKHDYRNLDGRGEMILNILSQIKGVEYIVLIKHQKENQIGLSIRGRMKPVNDIAMSFGGGGHEFAAGAVVRDDTPENIQAKIVELFRGR